MYLVLACLCAGEDCLLCWDLASRTVFEAASRHLEVERWLTPDMHVVKCLAGW